MPFPPEVIGIGEGDGVIATVAEDGVLNPDSLGSEPAYTLAHVEHIANAARSHHGVAASAAIEGG